jgi:hypothetical protein
VNGTFVENALNPLLTEICAVPPVVRNAAGIVAAICAAWTRLGAIVWGVLLGGVKVTVAPLTKFEPAMVIGVAALRAGRELGVTEVIAGVGGKTLNVCVTGVAAAHVGLPACVAVIEQMP